MTEVLGGVLMALGGGMLSASSIRMMNTMARPSLAAGVVAALPHTPAPADTLPDMLAMLDQLASE